MEAKRSLLLGFAVLLCAFVFCCNASEIVNVNKFDTGDLKSMLTVPPFWPNSTSNGTQTDNSACLIYPTCDVCSSSNNSCVWCNIGNGSCVVDSYNNTACPFEYMELGRCELNLSVGGVILSVIVIVIGFVATFWGYRLFKLTLFFAGFVIAGGLAYILLTGYAETLPHWATILISVLVGVVVGGLAFKIFLFGLFIIGGLLGLGVATFILSLKDGGLIESEWGSWVLTGALFAVGGLLAVFLQKIIIIIATTVSGSYGVISGIAYYVQREFADVIPSMVRNDFQMIQFNTVTWGLLGGLAVLIIAGMVVQFKLTGKKFNHRAEQDYPREYSQH